MYKVFSSHYMSPWKSLPIEFPVTMKMNWSTTEERVMISPEIFSCTISVRGSSLKLYSRAVRALAIVEARSAHVA